MGWNCLIFRYSTTILWPSFFGTGFYLIRSLVQGFPYKILVGRDNFFTLMGWETPADLILSLPSLGYHDFRNFYSISTLVMFKFDFFVQIVVKEWGTKRTKRYNSKNLFLWNWKIPTPSVLVFCIIWVLYFSMIF